MRETTALEFDLLKQKQDVQSEMLLKIMTKLDSIETAKAEK